MLLRPAFERPMSHPLIVHRCWHNCLCAVFVTAARACGTVSAALFSKALKLSRTAVEGPKLGKVLQFNMCKSVFLFTRDYLADVGLFLCDHHLTCGVFVTMQCHANIACSLCHLHLSIKL
jgi:hypothetical protein